MQGGFIDLSRYRLCQCCYGLGVPPNSGGGNLLMQQCWKLGPSKR